MGDADDLSSLTLDDPSDMDLDQLENQLDEVREKNETGIGFFPEP